MRKIISRIKTILWGYDTLYAEVLSGLLTLGWGLMLMFPPPGDVATVVFAFLASIIPMYMWGAIITSLGTIQLISALASNIIDSSWRRAGAILIFPFWLFLGIVILALGFTTVGFVFYGLFAVFCAFINFRLLLGRY